MELIGKISSFARSTIRRIKQRIWNKRPCSYADLPLVYKPVGWDRRCPRLFFDAEDNLVDFDTLRIISRNNLG